MLPYIVYYVNVYIDTTTVQQTYYYWLYSKKIHNISVMDFWVEAKHDIRILDFFINSDSVVVDGGEVVK